MNIWMVLIIIVSFIGFIFMGVDKWKAQTQQWRVPEKTLWLIAIIGGAPGMWIGMTVFRHKTQHTTFKYGFPALSVLIIAAYVYVS